MHEQRAEPESGQKPPHPTGTPSQARRAARGSYRPALASTSRSAPPAPNAAGHGGHHVVCVGRGVHDEGRTAHRHLRSGSPHETEWERIWACRACMRAVGPLRPLHRRITVAASWVVEAVFKAAGVCVTTSSAAGICRSGIITTTSPCGCSPRGPCS